MNTLKAHLYNFNDDVIRKSLEADRVFKRPKRGTYLGYPCMDEIFTSKKGEHCIVYGSPNSGKTTWVYTVAVRQAKEHGEVFVVWPPEEFTPQHVYKKLAYIHMGKHYETLTDEEQQEVAGFLSTYFYVLDTPRLGVTWLMLEMALKDVKQGLDYGNVIFDHLMMIEPDPNLPHEQNVRVLMSKVIEFCGAYNVFAWMINHTIKPNQYIDSKTHFSYIPPQDPSQMAHGQMWYRLCFNCIEVFRPTPQVYSSDPTEVWINVRKVKNPDVGKAASVGAIKLLYDVERNQYTEKPEILENEFDVIG